MLGRKKGICIKRILRKYSLNGNKIAQQDYKQSALFDPVTHPDGNNIIQVVDMSTNIMIGGSYCGQYIHINKHNKAVAANRKDSTHRTHVLR